MTRSNENDRNENSGDEEGKDGDSSNPNNSRTNNSSNFFYGHLTDRLRKLSFSAFRNCVYLWLGAKGYRDICVLKRSGARGRRRDGGADFIIRSPHESGVRIAVQIRHRRTALDASVVDQLWGFMLRQGVPLGLIVTNSRFNPKARTRSQEYPGRPIRLVSVSQLAGSMAALGLGIDFTGGCLSVSESFFRALDRLRFASNLSPQVPCGRGSNADSASMDDVRTTPSPQPQDREFWWWILLAMIATLALTWWLGLGGRR